MEYPFDLIILTIRCWSDFSVSIGNLVRILYDVLQIILWKMLSNDRPCLIFTDFLKLVCINIAINNNCYRTWSISADTSPNHRTHPCTTTETILHCGIHYSPGLGHKYTRVFSSMTVFHSSEKNTRFQLLSSI